MMMGRIIGLLFILCMLDVSAGLAVAQPAISFSKATSSGSEFSNIVIEVKLSDSDPDEVRVGYAVSGGSATAGGKDFTLDSGELNFAPGEFRKSIVALIVSDEIDELDETVTIRLSDPVNGVLGDIVSHTYTIEDDDTASVGFALSASEGHEAQTPVEFGVTLSTPVDRQVSVGYSVTGGTATRGDDFVFTNGTLNIAAGEMARIISLEIVNDDLDEFDETVEITLAGPTNAQAGDKTLHTYTIVDNDSPAVRFTRSTAADTEGVPLVEIALQTSAPSDRALTVTYTASGTAQGGSVDYTLAGNSITIQPGQEEAVILLNVVSDGEFEPDETVILTITDVQNGDVGSVDTFTYWIIEDDIVPQDLSLFRQDIRTRDGKTLALIGAKALSVNPAGIIVDSVGNLFISDQGSSRGVGDGSILMWPKGSGKVLRIVKGLTRPGDVELTPDGTTLVVAAPQGKVTRIPLGLSVRLSNVDAFTGGTQIHLMDESLGELVQRVSPDGYFHFTGLLVDGQDGVVDLVITHAGESKLFSIALGLPGDEGIPSGHRVMDLEF